MFKINELLEATGGRLIRGKDDTIIRGICIDSRTIKPQEAFIAVKGQNFDGHDFIEEAIRKGASCIVSSRCPIKNKSKITFIQVKDTTCALGDIARFWRNKFNIPVIAITGSNGKTTAKEMIAWILSQNFNVLKNEGTKNNHIGLPLTLLKLDSRHDLVILELGTNHFGEIDYLAKICLPNIGIITNIGPAHLEYFQNLEGVFREKYRLIESLNPPYLAILNADDTLLKREVTRQIKRPFVLGFGIGRKSDFLATDIKILNEKIGFRVNQKYKFTLRTLGYYNIYNALAGIAAGRIFGIEYRDIASRLSTFKFPPGRLNLIRFNKIRFIDDTYNSNPFSLRQALRALDDFKTKGKKIFAMGDMLELGKDQDFFHDQAGSLAAKICDVFITVGELSKLAARAAKTGGLDPENIFICKSVGEAGDILFKKVNPKKEDVVLVKGSRLMKMEEIFALSSTLSFT